MIICVGGGGVVIQLVKFGFIEYIVIKSNCPSCYGFFSPPYRPMSLWIVSNIVVSNVTVVVVTCEYNTCEI